MNTDHELDVTIPLPNNRADTLTALKDALKTAVSIELATIPIYLSTYYSINRNRFSGENMTELDVFADRAGGLLMSVAVEEMLHMSLSSNILHSLGEDPQLYLKSPDPYPTPLPNHNPIGPPGPGGPTDTAVLIPLAKFSYEQLWHLLQIEYPDPAGGKAQKDNWDTIGQFYAYAGSLISSPFITDADFQVRGVGSEKFQIQAYNYSPNTVDTAYPRSKFDPWQMPSQPESAGKLTEFPNAADSHDGPTQLLTISTKQHALDAIATICDQGEGSDHGQSADASGAEKSHYWKLLTLQAQLERYQHHIEVLPSVPEPPAPISPTITDAELALVTYNFPDNPTTALYQARYDAGHSVANYAPLSDLCNGVYQYMLILVETIFKVEDKGPDRDGQKLFFNQALHRSMIWVLDKLIQGMRSYDVGHDQKLAPTFENLDLGPRDKAHARLLELATATTAEPYFNDISYLIPVIESLPDVSTYWPAPAAAQSTAVSVEGKPTPTPYPYADAPTWPKHPPKAYELPLGLPLHSCMGLNSCKASDRFGIVGRSDGPLPHGPNECAGQGYCSTTSDHTCHVQNECRNQGGCGLYGTADELNNPAVNDCKSLGSCAVPINAERFSMNGPNRGKSVWGRAREVFADRWENDTDRTRSSVGEAPATLGPAPAPFSAIGPPYLWVSNDNTERGNMTSCGASGLSGAGGCSA